MTMTNTTTLVQMWQLASLLCRSQTSLIVKGYW